MIRLDPLFPPPKPKELKLILPSPFVPDDDDELEVDTDDAKLSDREIGRNPSEDVDFASSSEV